MYCTNNNIYECSIPTRKRINIFQNNVKSKTIKIQLWSNVIRVAIITTMRAAVCN